MLDGWEEPLRGGIVLAGDTVARSYKRA